MSGQIFKIYNPTFHKKLTLLLAFLLFLFGTNQTNLLFANPIFPKELGARTIVSLDVNGQLSIADLEPNETAPEGATIISGFNATQSEQILREVSQLFGNALDQDFLNALFSKGEFQNNGIELTQDLWDQFAEIAAARLNFRASPSNAGNLTSNVQRLLSSEHPLRSIAQRIRDLKGEAQEQNIAIGYDQIAISSIIPTTVNSGVQIPVSRAFISSRKFLIPTLTTLGLLAVGSLTYFGWNEWKFVTIRRAYFNPPKEVIKSEVANGKIVEVVVDAGDFVKKGDVVAYVKPDVNFQDKFEDAKREKVEFETLASSEDLRIRDLQNLITQKKQEILATKTSETNNLAVALSEQLSNIDAKEFEVRQAKAMEASLAEAIKSKEAKKNSYRT